MKIRGRQETVKLSPDISANHQGIQQSNFGCTDRLRMTRPMHPAPAKAYSGGHGVNSFEWASTKAEGLEGRSMKPFGDSHGHVLPHQACGKDTRQREVERNGPIGVVVPNRDVAGGGLYNQQHGRKLCCFFHRRPVLSPSFSGRQNVQDNGDGDEANQHAVEPLNKIWNTV